MGNKQGKVKPNEEGRWVEYQKVDGYSYSGVPQYEGTGEYFWKGPEPENGIYPPNPGETPDGILRLKKIKEEAAEREERLAARRKKETRDQQNLLDEEQACKTACDKAVKELRAARQSTQSAGRRKIKKYKQKRRKTYRLR